MWLNRKNKIWKRERQTKTKERIDNESAGPRRVEGQPCKKMQWGTNCFCKCWGLGFGHPWRNERVTETLASGGFLGCYFLPLKIKQENQKMTGWKTPGPMRRARYKTKCCGWAKAESWNEMKWGRNERKEWNGMKEARVIEMKWIEWETTNELNGGFLL